MDVTRLGGDEGRVVGAQGRAASLKAEKGLVRGGVFVVVRVRREPADGFGNQFEARGCFVVPVSM